MQVVDAKVLNEIEVCSKLDDVQIRKPAKALAREMTLSRLQMPRSLSYQLYARRFCRELIPNRMITIRCVLNSTGTSKTELLIDVDPMLPTQRLGTLIQTILRKHDTPIVPDEFRRELLNVSPLQGPSFELADRSERIIERADSQGIVHVIVKPIKLE